MLPCMTRGCSGSFVHVARGTTKPLGCLVAFLLSKSGFLSMQVGINNFSRALSGPKPRPWVGFLSRPPVVGCAIRYNTAFPFLRCCNNSVY
jgi:hypothetical protein